MPGKYLDIIAGRTTQKVAPTTSAGAGDADKIPSLDAAGKLDTSFMPAGIGADTVAATTSEALAAGDFVNLWNSTGLKARKADATTTGKEAHGFVLAAVLAAATATVHLEGTNTQVTAKTVGARQYLATTPGASTETAPTGSGNVVQFLGISYAATIITTEMDEGVVLA